ncbi:MAG TPA: C4-dicarboxylate ABC transporter substrate-binding protein, partial [Methyloceanibacter sp.]|nr:C4-dicarboxylate ABC transporter substrate-binding protein [Methyloceanibacter sp.]
MRIPLAFGLCLIAAAALAGPRAKDQPKPEVEVTAVAQNVRENFRARTNENVVTIMAGSPSGTDLAIVQDIASVLDDGDKLRVLPMVGKGPEQNIKDVLFLRGVDMGVTQANLLKHFDKTGELGPNLKGQ